MGQRSKRSVRCDHCRMHLDRCLCATLPDLDLRTRVELVLHARERYKPTSTGELATKCLRNSAVNVHGLPNAPLDFGTPPEDRRWFVLYPGEDAQVLDTACVHDDPRPVTLFVPDGNWRQASKMARRIPGLDLATPVVLPEGAPTRYRLRNEPKPGGLATMEAIARALGILEGPDVEAALLDVFDRMVEHTLETRQERGTRP